MPIERRHSPISHYPSFRSRIFYVTWIYLKPVCCFAGMKDKTLIRQIAQKPKK